MLKNQWTTNIWSSSVRRIFAVWLASLYEVGGAGLSLGGPNLVGFASLIANSDLAALMRKQSRLNFGGYRYCEVYGTAVTADGQQTQWCTKDDLVFDLKARGRTPRWIWLDATE